jgi:UDP-N-acetyl-D-mannosaminouronate:lipid I N-acetyl-D-mannosaminouronosyltransferase
MSTEVASVNGVNIFIFENIEGLLSFINGKKTLLIAINAGKIHKATNDTRKLINNNIGYIDGVGALYAVRKKGYSQGVIITGCDLWLEIVKKQYADKSFYLIGAKQEVIEKAAGKLRIDFPGINIKNYRNGYISTEDEEELLVKDIVEKKPDIIFVGMGTPRQELLMQKLYVQYPALYQGIGGSFDIYAGVLKRAPKWFIDHNLEGIYRVFTNITVNRIRRMFSDILFVVKLFLGFYK